MICEIIRKKGEKGSGGGRDAFAPGVSYVCSKAARVELRNLSSSDWHDAASEMLLTSELGTRVQKPYYHIVLSWHEHEQPTENQMFEAMDHLIRTLGLDEHQIVIGNHDDTPRKHIHAVANTIHPTTGKVWSKSQDHQKAELACRQIELAQGWTHDRGRFDFEIVEQDGQHIVRLLPAYDAWEKKQQDRAAGKRKPSPGDIAFQKNHGFGSFNQDIPAALKDRFRQAVARSNDWRALHQALAPLGLQYRKHGSGARIYLAGSEEFAKASAFGQAFSIAKMQIKLGPYEDLKIDLKSDPLATQIEIASSTGLIPKEYYKATKSTSFKLTLLRKIYTGLHLDDGISKEILYVKLDGKPPQVTFNDKSSIVDHGDIISASAVTEVTIKATVAMAKAKGWSVIVPSGPPEYIRGIAIEAAKSGLQVAGVPLDIQTLADEVLEQEQKKSNRLEREAGIALKNHLDASADREAAIEDNASDAARKAAEAIFSGAQQEPTKDITRKPGRPPVPNPQLSPDAARHDRDGKRRIHQNLRDNDHDEIENMKRVDIRVIAAMGGWSDASLTHHDSSDSQGKRYLILTRGDDTLKCSLIDKKWLWTSNKSGQSGSVIDLWRSDNPGKTLGHARAAFREILGTASPAPKPAQSHKREPEKAEDHTEARVRWEMASHVSPKRSYAHDRGISQPTLERFHDQVRAGVFGGIYFAHRNENGDIQGFEQRWQKNGQANKARFAKGGRKTVNVLGDLDVAKRMIVVEGGLDALALAELEARGDTIYVSTGGGFGALTEEALCRLAEGREVLSGFDNDEAGDMLHTRLLGFLPDAIRESPPSGIEGSDRPCKDWLDVLNAAQEVTRPSPTELHPKDPSPVQPSDESDIPDFT